MYRALREVLGIYLYRDLQRGWRVTSPNLEQSGLLTIDYPSLAELCAHEPAWAEQHPALAGAAPEARGNAAKVLLDHLRRELCIDTPYLEAAAQDRIKPQSRAHLEEPWALDPDEPLQEACVAVVGSRRPLPGHPDRWVWLSPRGGLGLYLKRPDTFPTAGPLSLTDSEAIIRGLLEVLRRGGLVRRIDPPKQDQPEGYQLKSSAFVWHAGEGRQAFHDKVRVPRAPEGGLSTNDFFVHFYQEKAPDLNGLEAREHTAQVIDTLRTEREERFREGDLPILFCSPTMELGVDIRQLNVVGLRNVPPTPANYAQRSGRAGRGGNPALVVTYCSAGSPHDQYFFKRPDQMVAGAVKPPRLDLGNEDLVRAHIHALWIREASLNLGKSLETVLDLQSEKLPIRAHVRAKLEDAAARARALNRAIECLGAVVHDHIDADAGGWIKRGPRRGPARPSTKRAPVAGPLQLRPRPVRIGSRPSLPTPRGAPATAARPAAFGPRPRPSSSCSSRRARRRHSDFYSYRYFASEGFLPGYNFPRLPLSAFLPGGGAARAGRVPSAGRGSWRSPSSGRAAIIYHEGSRYVINKVILPVARDAMTPSPERRAVRRVRLLPPR